MRANPLSVLCAGLLLLILTGGSAAYADTLYDFTLTGNGNTVTFKDISYTQQPFNLGPGLLGTYTPRGGQLMIQLDPVANAVVINGVPCPGPAGYACATIDFFASSGLNGTEDLLFGSGPAGFAGVELFGPTLLANFGANSVPIVTSFNLVDANGRPYVFTEALATSATAPEPSSLLLGASGLVGLLLFRRRWFARAPVQGRAAGVCAGTLGIRGLIQRTAFIAGVTVSSRALMLRDRLLRVTRGLREPRVFERVWMMSGWRRLAGTWVAGQATEGGVRPVVLICHGIGETVEHWRGVQARLEERGVGSLVYDYSGYGRSDGWMVLDFCGEDVATAYREVRLRVGDAAPVFVLGFSLGSGIAAAGAAGLMPAVAGLILCQAFATFREAVCATGLPRWVAWVAPDVWDTVDAVQAGGVRTLVVHGENDELFPLAMGRRIAEAGGDLADLMVVPAYGHDALYLRPEDGYWDGVVEWMERVVAAGVKAGE